MLKSIARTLLGGVFAATAAVTAAQAADKVVYQLDWLPGGDKAPIYVCIQKGFCADAGLDVTIEGGRGSSEAITKMATGVSDIGSAGIGALMAAKAGEGVPVTAVFSIFNKGPHAFYTIKGTMETIEDVKGKTVATSPFTESNIYLPLVLADIGLTEADITLTKTDPGALGPMLMTGGTDVIIAWLTDVARYTGQAKEAGKELTILPWSAAGLELYSASLLASDKFLTERPDVARRFIAAFKKSVEFAKANPREAAEAVAAIVPELSVENVEGSWKDASVLVFNEVTDKDGLGALESSRLAATWERVSAAQGLDPAKLDPETIVDRSFMPGN
ncbi:ABC transporter substrate-binding protein [Aquibium sp. ELW1220]|uniref:ABC transporter substrate-binding protein n=1 Tax=Aquibium sp. ELW1220 TaxID=2976766 RepID=UPI0025B1988C|nr:ABC transporter substrate-binding protein [Aquibium sp. ELW1220]MDN2582253.1 ABC transporter substrate-binding protein [Aquibium sp. ELW1220]